MRTFVAYVPVLHEGYRRFFESHKGPKELFILGPEITAEFSALAKEIRQLDQVLMKKAIEALDIFKRVEILDIKSALALKNGNGEIILPDEAVSRDVAAAYFTSMNVRFEPIFLRWDKHNALAEKPAVSAERVTKDELHRTFMDVAHEDAKRSSDNWRHVGAVVAKERKLLFVGHNAHVPSEHMPYVNGDPRNSFHKGEYIEISTALHAEAALIAEAARTGTSLEGSDLYVTMFPCPPCAKLIAYSGIKNVYCDGGYAILDGEEILKSKGVNIYFVE